MIGCPRCGAANSPASKFCATCGGAMPTPGAAEPSAGGVPVAAPPPGWGGPPQYGAPPQGPAPGGYGVPPGWGAPPEPPQQVGVGDGLNPFGPTMSPDQHHRAAAGAQPGGPQGWGAPVPQPGWGAPPMGVPGPVPPAPAPQPGWGAPPAAPQPGWGTPPPGAAPPLPVAEAGWGAPPQHSPTSPPVAPPGWGPVAPQEPLGPAAPAMGGSPTDPAAQPGVARDPEHVPAGAPRVLAGFLVSYEANELGNYWPIFQGTNTLGRKDAADGLTIEIDHPTTSSRHATLLAAARPGRIKVEDMGSTNGTFVDDERIPPGTRYELRDGQLVRFGGFTVAIKIV